MQKIEVESLKDEWINMISKSEKLLKTEHDHLLFCLSPNFGSLGIATGEHELSPNETFPKPVKYYIDQFTETNKEFNTDEKFLQTLYYGYEFDDEREIFVNGRRINTIEHGDYEFSEPIAFLTADWTADYLEEIESKVKKLYFTEASFLLNITYEFY